MGPWIGFLKGSRLEVPEQKRKICFSMLSRKYQAPTRRVISRPGLNREKWSGELWEMDDCNAMVSLLTSRFNLLSWGSLYSINFTDFGVRFPRT